jgi:hypothetical protein
MYFIRDRGGLPGVRAPYGTYRVVQALTGIAFLSTLLGDGP